MSVETFECWYKCNEDELVCRAAETGADREMCYDSQEYAEKEYEKYKKKEKKAVINPDLCGSGQVVLRNYPEGHFN